MVDNIVIVRGGGDIASGIIQKFYRSGFKVLCLETEKPTSIRRKVSFSEAVYDGRSIVEGIIGVKVYNLKDIFEIWNTNCIPVAVDPKGLYINRLKPLILIDAILAKRNLGTNMNMAPVTIGVGPGFVAGIDVNVVVETNRGHNLGRLIFKGRASKNTGIPGVIGGYSKERVIYSHECGIINNIKNIGDVVKKGENIAVIDCHPVVGKISGVLRGIIRNNIYVEKGLKIADIDPRISERNNCFTISDKARNIAGGVLEAVLYTRNIKKI